ELAAAQINARGGIDTGAAAYDLRIERLDNALSPQQAVDNVRRAVAEHALAIVDEGTGIDASWPIAEEAHIPICIVYQGGLGLGRSPAGTAAAVRSARLGERADLRLGPHDRRGGAGAVPRIPARVRNEVRRR